MRQPNFTVGLLSVSWIGATLIMFGTGISAFLTQSVIFYQTALIAAMVGTLSIASILFHLRSTR